MIRLLSIALLVSCGDNNIPTGEPAHFTLAGVISYEDRPQLTTGALGDPVPKVARGVQVAVIGEADGATLAMTVADDNGAYAVELDAGVGEKLHVLAATTSILPNRPLDVRNASSKKIHGFGGASFVAGSVTRQDLLVTVASGEAQAFNIFDTLIDVMDRLPALFPGAEIKPLDALWNLGNSDGTYYIDSELHLLGGPDDDDGFDDTVMLHESGHWIEDQYGRTDSPGGSHDGTPTDPNLAWSEGFATYFSMAITGVPIYGDSNASGGFSFNGDTTVTKANPNLAMSQLVSEDLVTEVLWDMGDAPAVDDDGVAGTHEQVIGLESYLRTATLRNVGKPGVNLVDALDAWFVRFGLDSCTGMRGIVDTTHTFPYDYGSSAGVCP